jgi:hypothetical protein
MRTRNIVLLIIIVILVLFGILFLSDKIFDSGLIEPVNGPVVEDVGLACEQDSDCSKGLVCDLTGVCYDACTRCANGCTILGPNDGACLDPTEELLGKGQQVNQFDCKLINGVCKKITEKPGCGDGICEIPEMPAEICAPCAVPAPRPCPCSPNPKYCPQDCEKRK